MVDTEQLIRVAEQLMSAGNARGAIDPLRKVLAQNPDHVLALAYLALCLHDTREHRKANAEIDAALELAPENGFVRYAAGIIALAQRRYGVAQAHLDAAHRLLPTDARVFRSLARLYDETGRRQRSLSTLQEGLKHESSFKPIRCSACGGTSRCGHRDCWICYRSFGGRCSSAYPRSSSRSSF
jgi:predicted Zn-dependent protease